jgi:biotin synthase-related radical SAM superfamily protein
MCRTLIELGVYPFVVPLVPNSGTPLENAPPPSAEFMRGLLAPLGVMLREARLVSADTKAGCAKCGACSSLSTYETGPAELAR